MKLDYMQIDSPMGPMFLAVDEAGALVRISFLSARGAQSVLEELRGQGFEPTLNGEPPREVADQLEAYFARRLTQFDMVLRPRGTPFQLAVWDALQRIPYGTCETYGEIARALGKPGASRAVGLANNRNPIPIVIPCHRVIGANGNLTGFGGGVENKIQLLRLEGYFML